MTKKIEDTVTLVTEITHAVDNKTLEPILSDERFEFAKYIGTFDEEEQEALC